MEVSGQLHAPAALHPGKESPSIRWIGGWVDPRAFLDAVMKRKIPSSRQETNPRTPVIQPPNLVAIPTELSRLFLDVYYGRIIIKLILEE
jgi:hypothetical protein